ncbi:MAG: hypothetical protein S4CHLAM102_08580 [Chlamydiia bacterium]|nr:hypothetical protein [Chlamydiia bacterium]
MRLTDKTSISRLPNLLLMLCCPLACYASFGDIDLEQDDSIAREVIEKGIETLPYEPPAQTLKLGRDAQTELLDAPSHPHPPISFNEEIYPQALPARQVKRGPLYPLMQTISRGLKFLSAAILDPIIRTTEVTPSSETPPPASYDDQELFLELGTTFYPTLLDALVHAGLEPRDELAALTTDEASSLVEGSIPRHAPTHMIKELGGNIQLPHVEFQTIAVDSVHLDEMQPLNDQVPMQHHTFMDEQSEEAEKVELIFDPPFHLGKIIGQLKQAILASAIQSLIPDPQLAMEQVALKREITTTPPQSTPYIDQLTLPSTIYGKETSAYENEVNNDFAMEMVWGNRDPTLVGTLSFAPPELAKKRLTPPMGFYAQTFKRLDSITMAQPVRASRPMMQPNRFQTGTQALYTFYLTDIELTDGLKYYELEIPLNSLRIRNHFQTALAWSDSPFDVTMEKGTNQHFVPSTLARNSHQNLALVMDQHGPLFDAHAALHADPFVFEMHAIATQPTVDPLDQPEQSFPLRNRFPSLQTMGKFQLENSTSQIQLPPSNHSTQTFATRSTLVQPMSGTKTFTFLTSSTNHLASRAPLSKQANDQLLPHLAISPSDPKILEMENPRRLIGLENTHYRASWKAITLNIVPETRKVQTYARGKTPANLTLHPQFGYINEQGLEIALHPFKAEPPSLFEMEDDLTYPTIVMAQSPYHGIENAREAASFQSGTFGIFDYGLSDVSLAHALHQVKLEENLYGHLAMTQESFLSPPTQVELELGADEFIDQLLTNHPFGLNDWNREITLSPPIGAELNPSTLTTMAIGSFFPTYLAGVPQDPFKYDPNCDPSHQMTFSSLLPILLKENQRMSSFFNVREEAKDQNRQTRMTTYQLAHLASLEDLGTTTLEDQLKLSLEEHGQFIDGNRTISISLKASDLADLAPIKQNFYFVIDRKTLYEEKKLQAVQRAVRISMAQMTPNTTFNLFLSDQDVIPLRDQSNAVDPHLRREAQAFLAHLPPTYAVGSTNVNKMLTQIAPYMSVNEGLHTVVFLSDGHHIAFNEAKRSKKIDQFFGDRLTVCSLGVGPDHNRDPLRSLAKSYSGMHVSASNMGALPRKLATLVHKLAQPIASNLQFAIMDEDSNLIPLLSNKRTRHLYLGRPITLTLAPTSQKEITLMVQGQRSTTEYIHFINRLQP